MTEDTLIKALAIFAIGWFVVSKLEKPPDKRTPGESKMIEGLLESATEQLDAHKSQRLQFPKPQITGKKDDTKSLPGKDELPSVITP